MSCDEELFTALPWPSAEANKYSRGKLVIVAGSARYPGAAALAARAAQRMGAGRLRKALSITLPSIMPTACTLLILDMGGLMSVGFAVSRVTGEPL